MVLAAYFINVSNATRMNQKELIKHQQWLMTFSLPLFTTQNRTLPDDHVDIKLSHTETVQVVFCFKLELQIRQSDNCHKNVRNVSDMLFFQKRPIYVHHSLFKLKKLKWPQCQKNKLFLMSCGLLKPTGSRLAHENAPLSTPLLPWVMPHIATGSLSSSKPRDITAILICIF